MSVRPQPATGNDEALPSPPPRRPQFSLWQLMSAVSLSAAALGLWKLMGVQAFVAVFATIVLAVPCFSRPRRLYVWLLPLVWTSVAGLNFYYPGDEYGGFGAGSLAGLWILPILEPISNVNYMVPPILLAGAATIAASGALMDRVRVPWVAWLVLLMAMAAVLYFWSFGSFPSAERALAKNGSYAAYILPSINLGLTFASIVMLVCTGVFRLGQWIQERATPQTPESADTEERSLTQ